MPTNFDPWPYGCYLCDGSTVIFNRRYEPIVRISEPAFPASGAQVVTACDPSERIEHSGQQHWFYSDANPPRRSSETRARLKNLLDTIPALAAEVQRRSSRRRTVAA
jgi:hypothetical protein